MTRLIEDIPENNSLELKCVKNDRDFRMKEAIINQKKLDIAREALTILSSPDSWLEKNIDRKVFINTIFSEIDAIDNIK